MDKSEARKKNAKKGKYNRGYNNKNKEQHDQNQENAEKKVIVPDNWSRYEISEKNEHECTESANFNLLLNNPISNYSFFKLKSEHTWEKDTRSLVELCNYFLLDLKLLSEGTLCVPFSKRQDLNLFSHTDIENNNKKIQNYATFLRKRYPQKIPNKFIDDPTIANNRSDDRKCATLTDIKEVFLENKDLNEAIGESKVIKRMEKINIISEVEDSSENSKDDVNELLSLKIPEHVLNTFNSEIRAEDPLTLSTVSKTITTTTELDLEQWLDDILDE